MSEQLVFDLPIKTAFGREDFYVSSSNTSAVKIIENWATWPLSKLILTGPSGVPFQMQDVCLTLFPLRK